MMFLILVFMMVVWAPFTVMHIITFFMPLNDQGTVFKIFYVAFAHFLIVNSCINPAVYAWQSTPFRAAYKEILGIKLNDKERQVSTQQTDSSGK